MAGYLVPAGQPHSPDIFYEQTGMPNLAVHMHSLIQLLAAHFLSIVSAISCSVAAHYCQFCFSTSVMYMKVRG